MSWQSSGHRSVILVSPEFHHEKQDLLGLSMGANAIVKMTADLMESLPQAIRTVCRGDLWVSRDTLGEYVGRTKQMLKQFSEPDSRVTPRQIQIIALLVRGFSNTQIASTLVISERTVKFHVSNILHRLGIRSRRELMITNRPIGDHALASIISTFLK